MSFVPQWSRWKIFLRFQKKRVFQSQRRTAATLYTDVRFLFFFSLSLLFSCAHLKCPCVITAPVFLNARTRPHTPYVTTTSRFPFFSFFYKTLESAGSKLLFSFFSFLSCCAEGWTISVQNIDCWSRKSSVEFPNVHCNTSLSKHYGSIHGSSLK